MSASEAEAAPPLMKELSQTIATNAAIVSHHLAQHKLPQPSFDSDGPSTVVPTSAPREIQQARQHLISASLELAQLAIGPSEWLPNLATGFQHISCLAWLCHYGVFHLLPADTSIPYADLAAAAGVPEQRLRSIMRMAMTTALFRETRAATHVGHSAASAHLARHPHALAYAAYMSSRTAPMALQMAAAHSRWGAASTRTYETAYNVAFHTDLPFFEHLARDEARMAEFAQYMNHVRSSEGLATHHVVNGFAWAAIRDGGVVVDVGGSTGGVAIALARRHPHLRLVVQDRPANAEAGRSALPAALASRITFQGHDLMQPQPVHGADVYLLRMILHDWSDEDAVRILQNVVPAMRMGTAATTSTCGRGGPRLLIMDSVVPPPGSVPLSEERLIRVRDLTMLQAFNGKERELENWKQVIAAADAELRLVNVVQPYGSVMSVLEVALGEYS